MIFPCSIVLRFYAPVLKPSILFLCQAPKRFMLSSPFTVKFSSFYSLFSFARGASHNKVWAVKMIWQCFPNINYRVHQPHTTSPSWADKPTDLRHTSSTLNYNSELNKRSLYISLYLRHQQRRLSNNALFVWVPYAMFLVSWGHANIIIMISHFVISFCAFSLPTLNVCSFPRLLDVDCMYVARVTSCHHFYRVYLKQG